ncbi:hypothetical protein [Pedobacter nanyangensis]|uniref:hypothetical protein n=1 Tax=Pedobacter nanyangensis TaxID=1562389 RepID=UPI0013B385F9|nr:hypothetical protein [Pedobacter nanyangensis]
MKKLFAVLLTVWAFNASAQQTASTALNVQRFRIAFNGGFSQMLAKTSSEVPAEDRDYVGALKSGYHYGIDATYFVKSWGLGLKFNQFKSSNSGFSTFEDARVSISDHLTTTFVGPSFSAKKSSASNVHTFVFGLGMGYLGHRDNSSIGNIPVKLTGSTFGAAIDAAYDVKVTKYLALGAQLSMVGGSLSKITVEGMGVSEVRKLEDNQRENLSRLDVSLGARFNF